MSYSLRLDPESNRTLHLKLFTDVRNLGQLKSKLLSGQLSCGVMNPKLICDPFQVVVAANKAVVAEKLTTRNVYSEILYNLSPSKNITQSLLRFGLNDNENNALVAVLVGDDGKGLEVFGEVDGEEVMMEGLKKFTNELEVKKVYKIGEEEASCMGLVNSVVTRIATKELSLH